MNQTQQHCMAANSFARIWQPPWLTILFNPDTSSILCSRIQMPPCLGTFARGQEKWCKQSQAKKPEYQTNNERQSGQRNILWDAMSSPKTLSSNKHLPDPINPTMKTLLSRKNESYSCICRNAGATGNPETILLLYIVSMRCCEYLACPRP